MENAFAIVKPMVENLEKDRNKTERPGKCLRCKTEFIWGENQWKRNCHKCGMVLVRPSFIPQPKIECWICMDTGIASYPAQFDDRVYEIVSACICSKGSDKVSDSLPRIDNALYAPPVEVIEKYNKAICKYTG